MTEHGYVTDEAKLLHEIRDLLRIMVGHRSDVLNYEHFDCCGRGMVPAAQECPGCHDTYVDLGQHLVDNAKGCLDILHATSDEIVARIHPDA